MTDYLAQVFLFAFDVRIHGNPGKKTSLKPVLERAFQLLPLALRKLVGNVFTGASCPSMALLSRANLFIDVAFMRVMADRHEKLLQSGVVFFGMTDASPQGVLG